MLGAFAVAVLLEFATGIEPMRSMAQDFDQCVAQPDLPWCQVECANGIDAPWCGKPMTADAARRIDERTRQAYRHREEQRDKWESRADAVRAGGVFRGDCDDITGTVIELLSSAGAQNRQLGRAIVRSPEWNPTNGVANHMFGLFRADGDVYIVGNSESPMMPLYGSSYVIVWHQWISEGLAWKSGPIDQKRAMKK